MKHFSFLAACVCIGFSALSTILLVSAPPASGRSVCDQLGRKVLLADNPKRVVSLAPSITEMIYELGEEQRLVGVAQQSDYPAAAQSLPTVGSYIRPDLEKIMALKPDLCIAIKDGNPSYVADRLKSLGIPVYAIDPHNLEGIMRSMVAIGELLGASEKAERIAREMQARVDRIESLVAQAKKRPKVFFQIGVAPIVSVGGNTIADELIATAGGENVARDYTAYPRFTPEQVLALQPDVIIITSMTRGEDFDRVKSQWNQWPSLPAVRNNRIFVLSSDLFDRPTARLVEGLELLARLIHPELFGPR